LGGNGKIEFAVLDGLSIAFSDLIYANSILSRAAFFAAQSKDAGRKLTRNLL
jgi:hypothetical protein